MTTTPTNLTTAVSRPTILIGGGLAALWLTLGIFANGTTYHLAPLLVATIPVLSYAFESSTPTTGYLLGLSLGGVAVALVIAAVLSATGNLGGPSLLPVGGATLEAVVFALVGGTGAMSISVWKTRLVSRSA